MPVPDEWVRALSAGGVERERAAARLHQMLLRVARAEAGRRSGQLRISGPELDDGAGEAEECLVDGSRTRPLWIMSSPQRLVE